MARLRGLVVFLLAGFASVAAQARPPGGGGATPDISVVRVGAALLVCVAAAVGLAVAIKGRNGGPPLFRSPSPSRLRWPGRLADSIAGSRRIQVIEARRVSAFADVCLIRCDQTEYLLVCGPSGQSVLRQSGPQAAEASDHAR